MIRDFRKAGDGSRIEADLCIVGSGPAGLALAQQFVGTQVSVVIVESGGRRRDDETERLNEGESVGMNHTGATAGRTRRFGGASRVWPGQCVPLSELDFEIREWVPHSGWPISMADLDPYYRRAEAYLGIAGERYDGSVVRRFDVTPPSLDASRLIYTNTVHSPHPDLARAYGRSLHRAKNVTTLLHATVTRVRTNPDGSAVDHVEIADSAGRRGQLRAKAHVLCAGGIENARLMLASNDVRPTGIGNEHDIVGRFFQEHLLARAARIETERPELVQELFWVLYGKRRVRYFPKLELAPQCQRAARVLGCDAKLIYGFREDSGAEAAKRLYKAVAARDWNAESARDLRIAATHPRDVFQVVTRYAAGRASEERPTSIWLETHSETEPNPESRITLSGARDRFGSPLPRIDWRLTDVDRQTVASFTEAVASEFDRLGLGVVKPADWITDGRASWDEDVSEAFHHMGATRMAADPKRGVVDEHCAVHGCHGLHIAGSSVFPTSGRANPTLTIIALSIRLGDWLKRTVLR